MGGPGAKLMMPVATSTGLVEANANNGAFGSDRRWRVSKPMILAGKAQARRGEFLNH